MSRVVKEMLKYLRWLVSRAAISFDRRLPESPLPRPPPSLTLSLSLYASRERALERESGRPLDPTGKLSRQNPRRRERIRANRLSQ